MGILSSIMGGMVDAANEAMKRQYKEYTGRYYDKDFRYYINEFSYYREDELKKEWCELANDTSIISKPKKDALIEVMKQKNISRNRDDYDYYY